MMSLASEGLIVPAVIKHAVENPHSEWKQVRYEPQPHPGPNAPAPFKGFTHNEYIIGNLERA